MRLLYGKRESRGWNFGKTSKNLITELEGTENRIFVARNDYNEVATKYNNKIRRFPSNMIAGMFGFEKVELVKADEKAKTTVPSVDLNN